MSKYLLLRNNKQAGPYTLDEIRAMALKAYDLVWVEGKSAAWRYPGEIEELKSFAPPVEEQPFDRFFKKPVQEDQSSGIIKKPVAEAEKSRYAPAVSEHVQAASTNKAIYINLPAEAKATEEKDLQEYVEKKQPQREKIIQQEPVQKETVQKSFSQSLPAARSESASVIAAPVTQPARQVIGLDDDYTSSADESKNLYSPIAPIATKYKKKNSVSLQYLIKPVAIGFGLILLLGAGIFIGLSINKRGLNSTENNISKEQNGVTEQQRTTPTHTIPTNSSLNVTPSDKHSENNLSGENPTVNIPDEKALAEKRKARALKQKIADSLRALKSTPVKIDSSSYVTQRETVKKPTEAQMERESIKSNIEDYVALSASKFNVGTFGGISDLQLTVSNTSPFPLELVVVEVQYIQSNKKIFKTENLYFHSIAAGAAIMEEAPKSSRGVKVKYRITIISSKNLGISFSEL